MIKQETRRKIISFLKAPRITDEVNNWIKELEAIECEKEPLSNLPQEGDWYIDNRGEVRSEARLAGTLPMGCVSNYNKFKYELTAQKAAILNKIQRALLQCRDELCPEFVEDYGDCDQQKYFVSYQHAAKDAYIISNTTIQPVTGVAFDTFENAQLAYEHVKGLFDEYRKL